MASILPPLKKPNMVAIAAMEGMDLLTVREYYITKMVQAKRKKDSDTLDCCLDWLDALTSEMRLRGNDESAKTKPGVIVP